MKLFCENMVRQVVAAIRASLPEGFTGKVVVTVHFQNGTASGANVACEEGINL